jgi:hypothetical protein
MMSVTRTKYMKILPILVTVMILALAIAPATVSAQDAAEVASQLEDDGDVADDGEVSEDEAVENEESAFQNPAQAQKAENVAEAVAMNSEDQELANRVAALEAAEEALEGLTEGDSGYADALAAVEAAEQDVADRLSEISGETKDAIDDMREEGYGWGQICHELGVHPSVLGNKYGHQKMSQYNAQARNGFGKKGEISAATSRDVKTGWARGHGKSVSGKSNGKGKADSFGVDNSGKDKGKSKGNSGGGKGGGKGGGGKGGGNGKK